MRVLGWEKGEFIPLTLADWDANKGTIVLVVQTLGSSSGYINRMQQGESIAGIAGPLGLPSELHRYENGETVVFTAGGVGLPPVYPIMREHLRMGNHVTLISGFRTKDLMFWDQPDGRVGKLQAEYPDLLDVIYATNDGSYGYNGFVTGPLEEMLEAMKNRAGMVSGLVIQTRHTDIGRLQRNSSASSSPGAWVSPGTNPIIEPRMQAAYTWNGVALPRRSFPILRVSTGTS